MGRKTNYLIALLVPGLVALHLTLAPYTKVEESFSIQAIHDILTYGVPWKQINLYLITHYDHFTFPGSVPRTFVGPLALAGVSAVPARLVDGINQQIFVRFVLGMYNAFSIIAYRNAVAAAFGQSVANWYILFQASQFHMMYYASRTLPNFFAFGMTTFALRAFLPLESRPRNMEVKNHQWSLAALTIVGIIFRSEIAILLAAHTVVAYYTKRIPLKSIITSGLTGVLIGLGLTVSIDSFFWQRFPLWPELVGFVYNVVNGQAASWGTSPFHFYFTSALPRLLYNPLTYMICIPFALSEPLRRRSLYILIPNLIFVGIYSLQPHKEWRFIVYSIPPFTAVAAQGADWVWNRRGKSQVYRLLSLILAISTLGAFASSLLASVISSLNYPGADAINLLHSHVDGSQDVVRVHMDTLSCMTGITRFLQMPSSSDGIPHQLNRSSLWIYDKTDKESELLHPLFWDNFDYSLSERPGKTIGAWENIDIVKGYSGIGIVRPGEELSWPPPASAGKCHKMRGEGPWAVFGREMGPMFREVAAFARKYITRGWWIQVKMEPKIHILKRAPLL